MKTRERIKQTGEIFTPPELTNEILDKLPEDVWGPEKTFCDPAAGSGNILIEVFLRKLSKGHSPLQAISTIYGVELMEDNVAECHARFMELIPEQSKNEAIEILKRNIICHDTLTWNFNTWTSNLPKSVKGLDKPLF